MLAPEHELSVVHPLSAPEGEAVAAAESNHDTSLRAFNVGADHCTTILQAVASSTQQAGRHQTERHVTDVTRSREEPAGAAKLSRPERIAAKPHSHSAILACVVWLLRSGEAYHGVHDDRGAG